ncbi:MAG TPA: ISAzo13 family transposase, partial [Lentisphaeria bacterium]|nr:ISAzo13 family transposase [Lentisphaeria bacterium]
MAAVSDNVNYKDFFDALRGHLDERAKRLVASSLAKTIGNISLVSAASGLSRPTIYNGLRDLSGGAQAAHGLPADRQRRPGAGAKRVEERNPEIMPALDALIKP